MEAKRGGKCIHNNDNDDGKLKKKHREPLEPVLNVGKIKILLMGSSKKTWVVVENSAVWHVNIGERLLVSLGFLCCMSSFNKPRHFIHELIAIEKSQVSQF